MGHVADNFARLVDVAELLGQLRFYMDATTREAVRRAIQHS
jgi:hypothetical protein